MNASLSDSVDVGWWPVTEEAGPTPPAAPTPIAPPPPNLRFEFKKIAFDKVLLLLLAVVAVAFNRYLEDYKSRQSWAHDISNQRIGVGRELSEAASTLESRHRHLVDVMRHGLPTTDASVQSAINDRRESADRLSSKCQFAGALLPDDIVVPFERFNELVFSVPVQDAPAIEALARLASSQRAAQNRLKDFLRPLVGGDTQWVTQWVTVPCTPPLATTKDADQILATTASFSGESSGRISRTWFDFDETPALKFSVPAVDGHGVAQGLKPQTTYYYRFVAQNECGTAFGATRTFTTPTLGDTTVKP